MDIEKPEQPIKLAIIGAGNRSTVVYQPLFAMLKPWVDVVAVCDPVATHSKKYAEELGIESFTSIKELVKSGSFEAAP